MTEQKAKTFVEEILATSQGQDYFNLDQKIEATRRETKKETDRLWEEIGILQDAFERLKNRKVG